MPDIFFTSDQHFGHERILHMCNRPFKDAAEMDERLIANWNAVVGPRDDVWCLGDFSMGKPDYTNRILSQLFGRKHLIRGNHDRVTGVQWTSIQEATTISAGGRKFYLHHYPVRDWPGKWSNVLHLYGHVHGNLRPEPGTMEVGVDVWGGRPVSAEEIVVAIGKFEPAHEPLPRFRLSPW